MLNPCSFCSAACCRTYIVTVTSFDVLRICEKTGKDPEEFVVFHPVRLISYDPDTVLDFKDGNGLLGFKSHPCVFLGKDNLCTIHEFAPRSCRNYPFTLAKTINARFCPLLPQLIFRFQGPEFEKELVREFSAYKEIVKEWNKNPGKREDCLSFILERSRR
jgi:Fe-S-cluster containining protein